MNRKMKLFTFALPLPLMLAAFGCQKKGEEPSTTTTTGAEMTATDQGESADDVSMTKQIRQRLLSDDALSTAAKDVTVITNNGMVTLRGNVQTDREKDEIELVARDVNGGKVVKNQLHVLGITDDNMPAAEPKAFPPKRPKPLEDKTQEPRDQQPMNDKY
jgi:hypothetical protein